MADIKEEVFLGFRNDYNSKLSRLAEIAQPEIWSFGKDKEEDPYRILRNYFQFTYNRLAEENKIITSNCGKYRCMNSGLLTKYNQEIVALFSQSRITGDGKLPWYFNGFYRESDRLFTSNFSKIPQIANYFNNPVDLIYDRNLEMRIKKEHIIDDNYERFLNIGISSKELIDVLLDSAAVTLEKKLKRNFKLALPFYYHNTETNEKKIQLLAPVYFPGSNVKLAFVLNKLTTSDQDYYEVVTVLPVEWAYMNARLIVRPDEEWAKILEESEAQVDDKFQNIS